MLYYFSNSLTQSLGPELQRCSRFVLDTYISTDQEDLFYYIFIFVSYI